MSDIGKRIGLNAKAIRSSLGFTLQDVANRSGLAKSYVWEMERGKNTNPSISVIMSLASALGCSIDDLVGAERYMKPQLRPEAMAIAVKVDELLRQALKDQS